MYNATISFIWKLVAMVIVYEMILNITLIHGDYK